MKAVHFSEHGGPEKLVYGDRPAPVPGPGEALVQVKACALNHLDIWIRRGIPGVSISLPHVPGADVAGVVEAVGPGVKNLKAGLRVLVAPGISCGACSVCRAGSDHLCDRYDILGQFSDGGYAQWVKVPAANLIPLPDNIPFEDAASFPLVFLTAWHTLVDLANVKSGETVLVHAGGSGVGVAAIQVAKLKGARVIATVGSDWKAERARALGADETINYDKTDFWNEVVRLTDRRGVDVVLDSVGQATFDRSLLCLAKGGRILLCGATTGRDASFDLRFLFSRNIKLFGSRMGPRHALEEAFGHFKDGRLKAVVDKVFPLPEAADAHRHMESRQNFGKIILKI